MPPRTLLGFNGVKIVVCDTWQAVMVRVNFSIADLFWILFIVSALYPMFRQRKIDSARLHLIRAVEKKRGSRVITLIHRQESVSIFGLLFRRYINIEDSEHVLRAIRFTADDVPIDIILHTPGGLVLAAEQIARAIKKHPAKVTVFVPHYAMSGGTLLALAADQIYLDENAVLGPVDPQIGNYPAASIVSAIKLKDRNEIDDETLILGDVASKALEQVGEFVYELLADRMDAEKASELAKVLTQGTWTHDYPLTCERLRELGLTVQCGLPEEIYRLMELYPQPPQRRPSVQYIPVPYRSGENRRKETD